MFGWEFPPFFAGGVGMVCYELTKQLSKEGVQVQYVMPFYPDNLSANFLKLYNARKFAQDVQLDSPIKFTKVNSILGAYQTEEEYQQQLKLLKKTQKDNNTLTLYGENMFSEIQLFAKRIRKMFFDKVFDDFDVIHAHDWTTIPAAIEMKHLTGKPLIVHVHITEFNKTGNNTANPQIYHIEKEGFDKADKVIAISQLIKNTLIQNYNTEPTKIEVIHNGGIEMAPPQEEIEKEWLLGKDYDEETKIVLYAGRITSMKGPLRFIEMANLVLKHNPKTLFVMAGSGDQLNQCIERTKTLGIENKFHFFGFYTKEDAEKLYDIADVFVLPSQLEPFGVTPLEAMSKKTPVVLSKQSGVAEIVDHCLFVDFWDIEKMASNIISLLKYPRLYNKIAHEGYIQAKKLDWTKPSEKCQKLYQEVLQ